ncbi:MAG: hypothetical protein IJT66_04145 [Clostridia bacterium]|nr:hypothetical protein [Clostridia bacterium]
MKKRLTLILSVLLAVVLATVGMIVTASADTYADDAAAIAGGAVCRIGAAGSGTYYSTLPDAVAAANAGSTITVIANTQIGSITIDKQLILTSENGSSVNGTAGTNNLLIVGTTSDAGDLTLSGNLKITHKNEQIVQMVKGKATIQDQVELTANFDVINMGSSGTPNEVEVVVEGGTISATVTSGKKGVIYMGTDGAKLTISGGVIKGGTTEDTTAVDCYGIRNFAKKSVLNITGGEVIADQFTVFYSKNGGGTVNMSGGTVFAAKRNQAFYFNNQVNTVTFNMTGGLVEAINENALFCGASDDCVKMNISGGIIRAKANVIGLNSNGETLKISGDAQVIATANRALSIPNQNTTIEISGGRLTAATDTIGFRQNGAGVLKITGGTITATESNAIVFGNTTSVAAVNISGGTIVSAGSGAFRVSADSKDTQGNPITVKVDATISGGNFSANDEVLSILANSTDAKVTVTGGTFVLNGTQANAYLIKNEGNLSIKGGLFVNKNTANTIMISLKSSVVDGADGTLSDLGGMFLYPDNITTLVDAENAIVPVNLLTTTYDGATYHVFLALAATDADCAGAMTKGAAVRLVEGKNGLKFTTVFSSDAVDALSIKAGENGSITYGTLIVPVTPALLTLDDFSIAALTAKLGANGFYNLIATANGGAALSTDGEGNKTLQAAITDLTDFGTSYAAISYACVTKGEETTYYFTAFNLVDNARSVAGVATAALADTDAGYTTEQAAILNGYVTPAAPLAAILPKKETWL